MEYMGKKRQVELRESESNPHFIGGIPSYLQKWGIFIFALPLVVIVVGSYLFKIPETLKGSVVIPLLDSKDSVVRGTLYLPPFNMGAATKGAKVHVFADAYPNARYGFLKGKVDWINGIPDEKGLYRVGVVFPMGLVTNLGDTLSTRLQLTGRGELILRERRLIDIFLESFKNGMGGER